MFFCNWEGPARVILRTGGTRVVRSAVKLIGKAQHMLLLVGLTLAGCVGDEAEGADHLGTVYEVDTDGRVSYAPEPDCDALASGASDAVPPPGGGHRGDIGRVTAHVESAEEAFLGIEAIPGALAVVLDPADAASVERHAAALGNETSQLHIVVMVGCNDTEELEWANDEVVRLYEAQSPSSSLTAGISPRAGVVHVEIEDGSPAFVSLLEERVGDLVLVEVVPEGSIGR